METFENRGLTVVVSGAHGLPFSLYGVDQTHKASGGFARNKRLRFFSRVLSLQTLNIARQNLNSVPKKKEKLKVLKKCILEHYQSYILSTVIGPDEDQSDVRQAG